MCKLVRQTKRANISTEKEIIFIRIQTTWDRWWSVRWVLCETWGLELTTMTTSHRMAFVRKLCRKKRLSSLYFSFFLFRCACINRMYKFRCHFSSSSYHVAAYTRNALKYIAFILVNVPCILKNLRIVSIWFRWTKKKTNYCCSYHFFLLWKMSYSVFPTNNDFFIGYLYPFVSYFHPYLHFVLSTCIAKCYSLIQVIVHNANCMFDSFMYVFFICCRQTTTDPFAIWIKNMVKKRVCLTL